MITNTEITAYNAARDLQVLLAPFSHEELDQCMPFPEEYKRFNPVTQNGPLPADAIVEAMHAQKHNLAWGIYLDSPATNNFVGVISISEYNAGTEDQPRWSKTLQETHTGIFSPEWHGKGIGTLAKLAVMAYAFEHEGTHVFYAQTSEYNVAAQRSLHKVGFSHLDSYKHYQFKEGGDTQCWMLSDPRAHVHAGTERLALEAGWARYNAAREAVKLTIDMQ